MKNFLRPLSLALLVSILPMCAWAQFSGNIQGDVHDFSGASITTATVTLTSSATNVQRTTTSDANGSYRFVSLAPSEYKISVTAAGFDTNTVTVTLLTNQTINLPLELKVAAANEQVSVTSEMPVLDTADSRTQMTIESQELTDLPLQGRNLLSLTSVAPGVVGLGLVRGGSPGSAADNFSTETQVDASANGRGSVGNMFIVDGMDVTSDIRGGVLNLTPNPDSIQETSIQTNTFSVQYGRASSVQTVLTTKSGSNAFHGNASDYFNYQNFWANTKFNGGKYNPFHSNNFSGSIGGPILPHRQLFFFFSVEPLRSSTSNGAGALVLEAPEFTNFAQQNFPNKLGTEILTKYKPSGDLVTGVAQTAADVFPTTCGTPATADLPCATPMFNHALFSSSSFRNGLQWNTRIDKYFSKDRIYGNIYRTTLKSGGPSVRPAFTTFSTFTTDSWQISEAHNFSSTMLNEVFFGYNKVEGIVNQGADFTVPSISVQGLGTGFGAGFAQGNFVQHNYHWRDVMTKVVRSHQLKFGYEGRRGDDLALFAAVRRQPNFSFNNLLDLAQDNPFTESNLSYDVLTGKPRDGLYKYAIITHGLFAEDTWKIGSRLTINYGLRWDDFGNPYPLKGTDFANFHFGPGQTFDQQVANGIIVQSDHVYNHALANAFSPRAGFSWDPTGSGNWVVRGGGGIFRDWLTLGNSENGLNGNPPGWVQPTFFNNGSTSAPIFALGANPKTPEGFPYPALPGTQLDAHGGLVGSQITVGGSDTNMRLPATYNYTGTVERRVSKDIVASVGYSGSTSRNLVTGSGQGSGLAEFTNSTTFYGTDINRFAGDLTQHNGVLTRLNPSFGAINWQQAGAQANYNALIVNARGRFTRRGYFNVSYTRSHSKDNSEIYPTFTTSDQYYSTSTWDVPQRLSISFNYELPGLNGGKGFAGRLTSGWNISDITILQSGIPFVVHTTANFQNGGDYNADGFNYDYPDVVSYAQKTGVQNYLSGIISQSQFTAPTSGTLGNETPYRFRNAGYDSTDLSVLKNTRIREHVNLQLRLDMFNAFNRTNLQGVKGDLSSGNFGKATNQFNPRWLQIGANISF